MTIFWTQEVKENILPILIPFISFYFFLNVATRKFKLTCEILIIFLLNSTDTEDLEKHASLNSGQDIWSKVQQKVNVEFTAIFRVHIINFKLFSNPHQNISFYR